MKTSPRILANIDTIRQERVYKKAERIDILVNLS